jgi:tetratricopeptide (TPR) repeat protein
MPDGNGQHVFFIDDELVERLMRGDAAAESSSKPRRPASSSTLAKAVKLAAAGRLDDAVKELEGGAGRGENPVEIYSGLGHLRFEQQKWEEAERCYGKVVEADSNHAAARYNLGLTLERQSRFEEAALSLTPSAGRRKRDEACV